MPLTVKGPRKLLTRYSISVLSGLLPILLGVAILYWQAERTLEQSTAQTAQEAVRQFDLMLDNTALAAQALLPLAGQPCDSGAQLALREQVTRRPFVRATTLSWQKNIYCTSLFGSNDESPVNPDDYVDGRLWLMNGNPVTPDTALLVYRLVDGDKAAFASIDGYHLTNALRLISRYAQLVLQVGPHWLGADGNVHETAVPVFAVAHHHLASERYHYSVDAGMPAGEVWRYMPATPRCSAWWCSLAYSQACSHTGCKSVPRRQPMSCGGRSGPMSSSRTSSRWYAATPANGPVAKC
jgi:hypothetical protein